MKENNRLDEHHHLSSHHHMRIQWKDFFKSTDDTMAKDATLVEKGSIVGRVGIMLLSCGTGAWRVRESMDTIARTLGITCSADIGLTSIEYTCFGIENHSYSQTLSLPSSGVNMIKLNEMEKFVRQFEAGRGHWTIGQIHRRLNEINNMKSNYAAYIKGLASGLACAGFIFLLGGGIPEVICTFFGAGVGNYTRAILGKRKLTLVGNTSIAVACACLVYYLCFLLGHLFLGLSLAHTYGYIGAMLFVIPGFPFITSGLDMAKLDMRSGLERLTYAVLVIIVATMSGWAVAMLLALHPGDLVTPKLDPLTLTILRLIASFCGVFGFSIMFNSSLKMAASAGVLGSIANTLRLSLVGFLAVPGGAAAFLGALVSGLLASIVRHRLGYPRIALTVPSIVIMVPGMYLYRGVFNLGMSEVGNGASWVVEALIIVIALPLGLIAARILTDPKFRHAE